MVRIRSPQAPGSGTELLPISDPETYETRVSDTNSLSFDTALESHAFVMWRLEHSGVLSARTYVVRPGLGELPSDLPTESLP